MHTEKEYIITLKSPNDWDEFHNDMIKMSAERFIPDRIVDCANDRPFSDTQSHYMLTDEEAESIAQDSRVLSVELHPEEHPNIEIGIAAQSVGKFDNTSAIDIDMKNWGLLRCTKVSSPFTTISSITTNFDYNLSGRGVDVVIIDTGIAEGHPEFAVNPDGTGGSRVVDFDWTSLGVTGVGPLIGGSGINGFLGDCDGHGSNVASIVAGNTCGWAREASIYSIRAIRSRGASNLDIVTGNTLGLIDITLVFDLVKAFHLSKPIRSTGYRRPTICCNSWMLTSAYKNMQQTYWRGTVYPTLAPTSAYGQVSNLNGYHGVRSSSIDTAAAGAMAAGVIMVGAAGNFSHKCDVVGGADYNNYWTDSKYLYYYHRGPTPGAARAISAGETWQSICVGATDITVPERKASFSETGPRVDIYSPGFYIMGCASTNYTSISDPRNGDYKLSKFTGTSQAAPQVAGVLACLAQSRPWMNQHHARTWLKATSIQNILNENPNAGTGYNNAYYLQGGYNNLLYMPYNSSDTFRVSGGVNLKAPMRVT